MTAITPPTGDIASQLRAGLTGLFAVDDTTTGMAGQHEVVRFRGRFIVASEEAWAPVRERFAQLGYTPLFRQIDGQDVVIAQRGTVEVRPSRVWINVVLFVLTVFSVLLTGALYDLPESAAAAIESASANPWNQATALLDYAVRNLSAGLPYAVPLLTILVFHEFGHYIAARRHKVAVSLPYFIPMPLPPLGTMGAAIVQKEPFPNRKVLFDIGVAGPLAGLIVTIPILIYGLSVSQVTPIRPGSILEGNSILYLGIKYLMFGRILPGNGVDVYISPIAFAGWVGLLVTSLNLLPAGQLDGGHIAYVLFGERTRQISTAMMIFAALLGIGPMVLNALGVAVASWEGWLLWAVLIYVFARWHPPALDEVTPLDPPRRLLAWIMVVIFVLVFIPVPFQLV